MARMKIRTKLFLSIIATGVLLAISGYLLFGQISKVGRSFDEVQSRATPSIVALGNIKSDFNGLAAATLAFTLHATEAADNPEIKATALEHLQEVKDTKAKLKESFQSYVAVGDKDSATRIGKSIEGITATADEMASVGQDVMNGGASAQVTNGVLRLHELVGEFDQKGMAFSDELDMAIDASRADMQAKQGAVLADIEGSTNLTVFLTVSAMAVIGVIGGLVSYSISKRVVQLRNTAEVIAQGNLQERITTGGSDEIAALASNFEHMRKSLVQAQEELKSSNLRLQDLNAVLEKTNAELKKLDRLKDEFISVAAHELRTPIHPILGYASMAKDGMVPSQQALDMIYKQALRLKQLANDILDVSRIESGTLPYSMKKIGIHEILMSCADAIRPSLDPAVSLIVNFDRENEEVEVMGDRERLNQVFMNILGNSLKFTKQGRIMIETRLNAAANTFEITISDTAGGIPAEILPNLFGKFVTKKVGENVSHGTGLGLFISKSIVTAHKGTISAYNNNIGGATFKIELPTQGRKLSQAVVEHEKKLAARPESRQKKSGVISDRADNSLYNK
jgi:signal transduction histidine kinase